MTKITLEKLASIPEINFVQTTKNKDKVGFYWNKTKRQEFYVLDPSTMKLVQISDGQLPKTIRAFYLWLKDGKHIIYPKDKDGDEQHNLYLFNIETKKVEQLTDTPEAQEYPLDTSPDDKKILFSSNRHDQLNLFIMDLETKEIQQLTAHDKPVFGNAIWGKEGWIYYNFNDTWNINNNDIWAIKEDGSEIKMFYRQSEKSGDGFSDLNEEGTLFAITSNYKGINQAGILTIATGEVTWLSEGKYEEYAIEFSKDGKKLVVLQNKEAQARPVIYDVETGYIKELDFEGIVYQTRFCLDDKYLLYTRNDPKSPLLLARYDLEKDVEEVIIPPQTDIPAENFYEMQYIKYTSFDGLEIPSTIYTPKLEAGKKYPALVNVHGGPTAQYFRDFDMFSQVFAHEGFVILNPNIRGSTGYGKEFQEMNMKDWGGKDGKDVVYAKKYLEKLDYVDPKRIGIFGGSYGGFMTFLQLTKFADASWKTGSSWVGISNMKTFYNKSKPHYKVLIDQYMGNYENNKESWENASAMNFIENIKTPIQIIHGINDPRCPIEESRQFRDKLIEMGWKEAKEGEKTYEYVEFADEGHGAYSDIPMRIRTFKLFIDYFKRRL